MKLTKQQCSKIIIKLDDFARSYNYYEYGLPIHDEPSMAKMRELIHEALDETN